MPRLFSAPPHRWDLSIPEAFALQKRLAKSVREYGEPEPVRLIAGCDLSFDKAGNRAFGALVLLRYPGLETVDEITHAREIPFPYVPGLLSFREGPVILDLFRKLKDRPDLILFDGQGRAHPRGLGIASHLGLLLGIPSIGAAKSRLFGMSDQEPGPYKGDGVDLRSPNGQIIGRVLRSRDGTRPLYVSVGHGLSLEAACRWTLACCRKTRLPEPTRLADRLAAKIKKSQGLGG